MIVDDFRVMFDDLREVFLNDFRAANRKNSFFAFKSILLFSFNYLNDQMHDNVVVKFDYFDTLGSNTDEPDFLTNLGALQLVVLY